MADGLERIYDEGALAGTVHGYSRAIADLRDKGGEFDRWFETEFSASSESGGYVDHEDRLIIARWLESRLIANTEPVAP